MQIGSIRVVDPQSGHTSVGAGRLADDHVLRLPFTTDELLHNNLWDIAASDSLEGVPHERVAVGDVDWAPLVAQPSKIFCVGLNYREHVVEMGRELPSAPTYFAKFPDALIGAHDDIVLPPPHVSTSIDFEVELCVVIGTAGRYIDAADALDHVAGYTIMSDVSVRDWQRRTTQFLAGKTFEALTPVGPVLTTTDELGDGRGLAVTSTIDGVVKQNSTTDELIFGVPELIADLSKVCTLKPGDLIATGTPSGVGAARTPPEWLAPGSTLVTAIEGIGELRNRCTLAATS